VLNVAYFSKIHFVQWQRSYINFKCIGYKKKILYEEFCLLRKLSQAANVVSLSVHFYCLIIKAGRWIHYFHPKCRLNTIILYGDTFQNSGCYLSFKPFRTILLMNLVSYLNTGNNWYGLFLTFFPQNENKFTVHCPIYNWSKMFFFKIRVIKL
jgi:hypothetical protein